MAPPEAEMATVAVTAPPTPGTPGGPLITGMRVDSMSFDHRKPMPPCKCLPVMGHNWGQHDTCFTDFPSPGVSLTRKTPAPCSTRPARSRRRVRVKTSSDEDEDEEVASPPPPPSAATNLMTRSHRASKAAALAKMTASRMKLGDAEEDDEEEEGSSDVTAEDSDESE